MVRIVRISSALSDRVIALAAACPDREVCGLLLGSGDRILDILPLANVAAAPADSFEIDPAGLLAAHRRQRGGGPAILGHYHSHPGGSAAPSPRDAAAASGDGRLWLVVAGREARLWAERRSGTWLGAFDAVETVVD